MSEIRPGMQSAHACNLSGGPVPPTGTWAITNRSTPVPTLWTSERIDSDPPCGRLDICLATSRGTASRVSSSADSVTSGMLGYRLASPVDNCEIALCYTNPLLKNHFCVVITGFQCPEFDLTLLYTGTGASSDFFRHTRIAH